MRRDKEDVGDEEKIDLIRQTRGDTQEKKSKSESNKDEQKEKKGKIFLQSTDRCYNEKLEIAWAEKKIVRSEHGGRRDHPNVRT